MNELKGRHVFAAFSLGFGIIIAVNLTLAFSAIRSFPGLEVRNSYVASQSFDRDRAAQEALAWEVSAWLNGDQLSLSFAKDGKAVAPVIESAVFGRATSVTQDQNPDFIFNGAEFTAPVTGGAGNWNLRIRAKAEDGTTFFQRIVVRHLS